MIEAGDKCYHGKFGTGIVVDNTTCPVKFCNGKIIRVSTKDLWKYEEKEDELYLVTPLKGSLIVSTKKGERYVSLGKHKGEAIPTITTTVSYGGGFITGNATCDEVNFDKRQGVLEALANAICNGNFDREYNKLLKCEAEIKKALCTCSACGKIYETTEEARACREKHIENKKARIQKYRERKEARDRIAASEYEGRITKLMKEMLGDKK